MVRRGFTLLELTASMIIIGILSTVAVPNFVKMKERTYWQSARDVLLTIYNGERAYFFSNNTNTYVGSLSESSPMSDWRQIFMDNPYIPWIPIKYSVSTICTPAPCFIATADRGSGRTMTVNQDRLWCDDLLTDPTTCDTWSMP